MKSQSIALRIADFLRRHPPFQPVAESELVALAARARVRFHEEGELVFSERTARHPWVYVIQKGKVRLTRLGEAGEEVVDWRGEGDLLGLNFFLGGGEYIHSARTEAETILYALPAADLPPLLARHPEMVRYLAAYFSVSPHYPLSRMPEMVMGSPDHSWLNERLPMPAWVGQREGTCLRETPVREVARLLSERAGGTMAVVDGQGRACGVVSAAGLVDGLARGRAESGSQASAVMSPEVVTAPPGLPVGDYLIRMLRPRTSSLCLTEDGTAGSRAIRGFSSQDLMYAYGADPVLILLECLRADNADDREVLRHLSERFEAVLRQGLHDRSQVEWYGDAAQAFLSALVSRCRVLAHEGPPEKVAAVPPSPGEAAGGRMCVAFYGKAGRRCLWGRGGLRWMIIGEDGPPGSAGEVVTDLEAAGRSLQEQLRRCGLDRGAEVTEGGRSFLWQPLSVWRDRFSRWVRAAVESGVAEGEMTEMLDLLAADGHWPLVSDLQAHIRAEVRRHPRLAGALLGTALGALPDRSLRREFFLEQGAREAGPVDLERYLIGPITAIARAIAMQLGLVTVSPTGERLRAAAAVFPDQADIFGESIEALRLGLFLQARESLRGEQAAEGYLDPSRLSRLERHSLRSAFRAVLDLVELVSGPWARRLERNGGGAHAGS